SLEYGPGRPPACMHPSSEAVAWSRELRFAAPRPSGEVVVRVGRRYLLASPAVALAMRHLASAPNPLDSIQAVARLEEVVSPSHAIAIERRLAGLLRSNAGGSDFLRRWLRGIVRIPLWRPEAEGMERLRGLVLTRGRLAILGAATALAIGSLFV